MDLSAQVDDLEARRMIGRPSRFTNFQSIMSVDAWIR
jgi:hypothetical protein